MKLLSVLVAVYFLAGCAATAHNDQLSDSPAIENQKPVQSSNEAVTTFVAAHQAAVKEMESLKAANAQAKAEMAGAQQAVLKELEGIKAANQQLTRNLGEIKATDQQVLGAARQTLRTVEEISKRQGTGEITLFFPTGSAVLPVGSLEYDRLVHFADFLARESRGRKIIFLSIGSASATGSRKANVRLAKKRSEAPLSVLDQYLVNIPHEYYQVHGTGDLYSPKGMSRGEHQRYQHVRIIALFDAAQAPTVNAPAN